MGDEGDERKNVFGIVPQQLGGSGAALRYLNRAFRKYRIAEWHLRRFEQLEDELRVEDLFKFERGEPAMRPQAHADGTVLQLAAVFDAFACAVAHKLEVTKPDPDKADFARDYATLATKIGGNLGAIIEDTGSHRGFYELQAYRNLAAHRGVLGENQGGTSGLVASEANRVRLLLPEWVPADVPTSARPLYGPFSDASLTGRDLGFNGSGRRRTRRGIWRRRLGESFSRRMTPEPRVESGRHLRQYLRRPARGISTARLRAVATSTCRA